jgi:hypothetical protein
LPEYVEVSKSTNHKYGLAASLKNIGSGIEMIRVWNKPDLNSGPNR